MAHQFRAVLREAVVASINSEREYQIQKWGVGGLSTDENPNTVGNYILYIVDYLREAKAAAICGDYDLALCSLRKVAALGVACLERHAYGGHRAILLDRLTGAGFQNPAQSAPGPAGFKIAMLDLSSRVWEVVHRATRRAGDQEALIQLHSFTMQAMEMMAQYGAPLRSITETA